MHFLHAATILAALLPGALANTCRFKNRDCHWEGTSPGCGDTDFDLESFSMRRNEYLLRSTKNNHKSHYCSDPKSPSYIGESCCNAYGAGCWSGYKRLWCTPLDWSDDTSCDSSISYYWITRRELEDGPSTQLHHLKWEQRYFCIRDCITKEYGREPLEIKRGECFKRVGRPSFTTTMKLGSQPDMESKWEVYSPNMNAFNTTPNYIEAPRSYGGKAILKSVAGISTYSTDFSFEAIIKPLGNRDAFSGLVFRVSDPGDGVDEFRGYYAGITTSGFVSLGVVNNNWKLVKSAMLGEKPTQEYRMKVVAVGPKITVYLHNMDEPAITVSDETYSGGSIGVRVVGTRALFSNIALRPIVNGTVEAGAATDHAAEAVATADDTAEAAAADGTAKAGAATDGAAKAGAATDGAAKAGAATDGAAKAAATDAVINTVKKEDHGTIKAKLEPYTPDHMQDDGNHIKTEASDTATDQGTHNKTIGTATD